MAEYPYYRLVGIGITREDAYALRRIAMTLHRWHELECGDSNDYNSWSIVRGEQKDGEFHYSDDGAPYLEIHPHTGKVRYERKADREKGALRRLIAIMDQYPKLAAYVQTDPRGAALYVGPKEIMNSSQYSGGVAVYK